MMQGRRVDELESFFNRYTDVPREVIVKDDLLRLGLGFTDRALEGLKHCRVKSYRLFTYDKVKSERLISKGELFKAPEDIDFFGGPYNLRITNVQVRNNPDSPYQVDVIDGRVLIVENGNTIAEVKPIPAPNYYSKTFEDGSKYPDIVAMANCVAFATVFTICQLWGEKEECKFCDINENVRQIRKHGKLTIPKAYKPIEQVREVMEEIFLRETNWSGKRPLAFIISGGVILDKLADKTEEDFYIEYVQAVKERIGDRWPAMVQVLARDKKTLRKFKEAGVDGYHAQLEVWDKNLFKILCPGKEKYVGWDEWVRRTVDAVDVFGEGNVTPGLVAGVEMCQPYGFKDVASAIKSTSEGFDFLMSHGVGVRYNVWNISPLSALAGNKPPPLEYYIELDRAWCETWNKYRLPPPCGFGPVGPGRATTSHSSYLDMDPVLCGTR